MALLPSCHPLLVEVLPLQDAKEKATG